MKRVILITTCILFWMSNAISQELAPYIKVGESTKSVNEVAKSVSVALEKSNFTILGTYSPANKSELKVIVFTRNDVKRSVVKVADRGALAAAFKVGIVRNEGKTTVSYTNPEYIFRAYLKDNYISFKSVFNSFSADIKKSLSVIGTEFKPFGGSVKTEKLKKYHYKVMMPYFSDPVTLNEYDSFEEGLKTIESNISKNQGNITLVYKLVYPNDKVAVFGIGLNDEEEGEPNFLPKIGEAHAAAMPYEMILQGNELTMLHGKYRIALHWPDLTMGTFMKIMSTPGDIKDALKSLGEIH